MQQTKWVVDTTPPGANTTETTIFDTSAQIPSGSTGFIQRTGLERVTLIIGCSGAGTLKTYFRENDLGSFIQYNQYAVSADDGPWTSGIPNDHDFDFYVGRFDDWKLTWTNTAAVAQSPWWLILKTHLERCVVV